MLSKWLQEALDSSGVSQSELARLLTEKLGRSIDRAAVNKMAKGSRAIAGDELLAITEILSLSPPGEILVPLKGRVGAGQAIEPLDSNDAGEVEAPPHVSPDTVAVEVSGDSMLPVYEEGNILYYSKNLPPAEMINKRCVVKLASGEMLVKVLRRGSADGLWNLQSLNPATKEMTDQVVEWAAPIDWIRPGR